MNTVLDPVELPALRPWNPFDQMRLLWWLTIDRRRFEAFRIQVGEEATRSAIAWLVGFLVCVPSLMVVLGSGLHQIPVMDGGRSLLWVGALVVVWMLIGIIGKSKRKWVPKAVFVISVAATLALAQLAEDKVMDSGSFVRAFGTGMHFVSLAVGFGIIMSANVDLEIGEAVAPLAIYLLRYVEHSLGVFFLLLILLSGTDFLLSEADRRGHLTFWQNHLDSPISKVRALLPSWAVLGLLLGTYSGLIWDYLLGG